MIRYIAPALTVLSVSALVAFVIAGSLMTDEDSPSKSTKSNDADNLDRAVLHSFEQAGLLDRSPKHVVLVLPKTLIAQSLTDRSGIEVLDVRRGELLRAGAFGSFDWARSLKELTVEHAYRLGDDLAGILEQASQLESLTVHGGMLTSNTVEQLQSLKHLKELVLSGVKVQQRISFEECGFAESLRKLALVDTQRDDGGAAVDGLFALRGLSTIDIRGITANDLTKLLEGQTLKSIKSLTFEVGGPWDDDCDKFLKGFPGLAALDIRSAWFDELNAREGSPSPLSTVGPLDSLVLEDCEDALAAFEGADYLPHLRKLGLLRSRLDSTALVSALQGMISLVSIDLRMSDSIDDRFLKQLPEGMDKLKELRLSGDKVTSDGFRHLLDNHVKELRVLDISGTAITTEALASVTSLESFAGRSCSGLGPEIWELLEAQSSLEYVDLRENAQIDAPDHKLELSSKLKEFLLSLAPIPHKDGYFDFEGLQWMLASLQDLPALEEIKLSGRMKDEARNEWGKAELDKFKEHNPWVLVWA